MPWVGSKKVAFIPLYRTNAAPPDQIPPDWGNLIRSRVASDPDPKLAGADGSLRAWVRAASSGRADIEPVVLPMQKIDRQDVLPDALESQMGKSLREQGFDHAAIVMLGGLGAGSNAGFWSRFVMVEHTGVWAMEIIHGIAGFLDLYHQNYMSDPADRAIDRFDQMSHAGLSHPTVFTKGKLGWLDDASITRQSGARRDYELHWVGLPQPPPSGRSSAVRIGKDVPYLMVEARKRNDQFETGVRQGFGQKRSGIKGEGVIVYRVQTTRPDGGGEGTKLPLYLLTQEPLRPGESATVDGGIVVANVAETDGGNTIRLIDPTASGVLLRYKDLTDEGTPGHSDPIVIGGGGWQAFRFLLGGGNGIIYAVNDDGHLIRYKDLTDEGTPGHSDPIVIGGGGWQAFKFLLGGGNGIIHAVVP